MRVSVVRGSLCTMHRQIAGTLTGPVTKWIMVLVVVLMTAGFGFLGTKLADVKNNEASSWLPSSAEATKVSNELSKQVNPNDIPTLVVFHRTSGLTSDDFTAIDKQADRIAKIDGVTKAGVLTPNMSKALLAQGQNVPSLTSPDGQVAYMYFVFNFGKAGWNKVIDPVNEVKDITKLPGADVYVGGFGGQAADFIESFEGSNHQLLFFTFLAVIAILLLAYRSPTLVLLVILCAGVAEVMAGGVVYLLAKYADLTVNDQSQYILGILTIGAGTDYALLLVARYREELRNFEDRHDAMAHALHRAGPALIASAATVAVGLMCLSFADLNSTASLGPVLAVGILVTLFVMVVFLPALFVVLGRWIFWPKRPSFGSLEPTQHGFWAKVGTKISPRPRAVWVTTAVLLAIACLGLFKLDANGLTTEQSFTSELKSVTATKLLVEHGLSDQTNTIQVVANADRVDAVRDELAKVPGMGHATDVHPLGDGRSWFEAPIRKDMASQQAWDIVEAARTAAHDVSGADAFVGGASAFYLDTKTASQHDSKLIIPIVLVVVLLILVLLLRSLLSPLILLGTVILSFGSALGLSTLLFTYVFGFEGVQPDFALFTFVFLVALGIDYNIFLMTRVREESLVRGTRKGSLVALSSTGGVITSAGMVLAATFLVLGTLPMVFLAELGVAVALGVLLDTMIVRSVLVTAINLDLGDKIWWPSKLAQGKADPEDAAELVNV
jgi:RND superfamily putative drug exporter